MSNNNDEELDVHSFIEPKYKTKTVKITMINETKQMTANELRIGNLVRDKISKTEIKIIELTEQSIGTYVVDRNKFPLSNGWSIEPIPLTEEWLLKLGFEKQKGKIDIFEKSRLRIWIGARGQSLCYLVEENTTSAHYIPNSLEHVHQLQNLYFALTGIDLTHGGNK
jgi:hypothetical protein